MNTPVDTPAQHITWATNLIGQMSRQRLDVAQHYAIDEALSHLRRAADLLAAAAKAVVPCDRRFELLGLGAVRVHYSCGKVIEFGNLPPWPANDAVLAARLPNAPHPHDNAEMRWPR